MAGSGGQPTGVLIINAFGHFDFEAYSAWVDAMDAQEFANHAEALQAIANELMQGSSEE